MGEFAAAPAQSGDAHSGDEYDDEDIAARPSRSGDEYDDEEFAQEDYELQRPDDDDMRVPDAGADSHGPGVQDEEYDDEYSDQEFARQSQYLDESLSDQAGARTELRDERHLPARSPSRFGQVGRESDEEDSYSDAEPAKESQVLGRQRGEPPLEESSDEEEYSDQEFSRQSQLGEGVSDKEESGPRPPQRRETSGDDVSDSDAAGQSQVREEDYSESDSGQDALETREEDGDYSE